MENLVNKLFTPSEAQAINSLWRDKELRLLIKQQIGRKIIEQEKIIVDAPFSQLILIVSLSPFAETEQECVNMASIIYWARNKVDILPYLINHIDYESGHVNYKEFAYSCLISLGFFKKALVQRFQRRAAPSPSYYRQAGAYSFDKIGMDGISHHFAKWENYIGEMFI